MIEDLIVKNESKTLEFKRNIEAMLTFYNKIEPSKNSENYSPSNSCSICSMVGNEPFKSSGSDSRISTS